jgi:hypothetical protein
METSIDGTWTAMTFSVKSFWSTRRSARARAVASLFDEKQTILLPGFAPAVTTKVPFFLRETLDRFLVLPENTYRCVLYTRIIHPSGRGQ